MWTTIQRKIAEILERFLPSLRGDRLVPRVTPQYLAGNQKETTRPGLPGTSRYDARHHEHCEPESSSTFG